MAHSISMQPSSMLRAWCANSTAHLPNGRPHLLCPPPRRVKITVRDTGGEGSNSLLGEDSLFVELRAGPPAQLAVEGPATLECGTKMAIPQLRVRVCDSAGNPTTGENFEVRLPTAELGHDAVFSSALLKVGC